LRNFVNREIRGLIIAFRLEIMLDRIVEMGEDNPLLLGFFVLSA